MEEEKKSLVMPHVEKEGKLVFIVERDPFYRNFIEYCLKKHNYEVEFAFDGISALKRAKIRKPDLFVLDVILPRFDGLTLCRYIREDEEINSTPIIIFTILNVKREALEAGADFFLSKPFDEEEFMAAIFRFLPKESEKM